MGDTLPHVVLLEPRCTEEYVPHFASICINVNTAEVCPSFCIYVHTEEYVPHFASAPMGNTVLLPAEFE